MNSNIVEKQYPITFRHEDAAKLGMLLKNRRSVVLVGMKRVGISNFLRFFLNHKEISQTYIQEPGHLFIQVDLNDLVERDIFPFWILTFKRLADYVDKNIGNQKIKKRVNQLFLDSIQSQDLFLTIDGIRESLVLLSENGYTPTIFFIRFDRIIEYATSSFFGNFEGLIDATQHKLSFVFTSVRPLDTLSSEVFTKHALSVFADTMYIEPAKSKDVEMLFSSTAKKYNITISDELKKRLLSLVDGYNQYLQFALIKMHEEKNITVKNLEDILLSDERISLQSEELWESLAAEEKAVLEKIIGREKLTEEDRKNGEYLFKTGLITENGKFFSVLFEAFLEEKKNLKKKESHVLELSKKEHILLQVLRSKKNDVCEREEIIERVWQEAESIGVSDWAIDRLVARLRSKLKSQGAREEIITVKTRGYKLIGE
ncbi:MAG: helix-turn-helix domain-containing protein [Candidatus Levyibacteriota bacterium]